MAAAQTYEPIATTTVGTAVATITFSSIPSTYTDIVLVVNGTTNAPRNFQLWYNTDTGTNYSFVQVYGNGTSAGSSALSGEAVNRSTALYSTISTVIFNFMNYSNTTTYKTVLARGNNAANETKATVSLWRSTAAINRIDMNLSGSDTFNTGSTFTLYGIKAA